MRRPGTAGGLVLTCLLALGCLNRDADLRTTNWFEQVRQQTGAAVTDGFYLQTVLLEQPVGDRFLQSDLWLAVNKPFSHELSTLLLQNGLRVGTLSGMTPPEFDTLIENAASTNSPMTLRTMKPGVVKVVPVNGPVPNITVKYFNTLASDSQEQTLSDAECGMAITVHAAENGRVTLRCEPQIQHGAKLPYLRPTQDGTGLQRSDHKPLECYPALAFEVTLDADDYLVIGASSDPFDKLGQAFFLPETGDRIRQRILVIRPARGRATENAPVPNTPAAIAGY